MTRNNLDTLRDLISSTFDEKSISICHTDFFTKLKTHGWEQAEAYIKGFPGSNEFAASPDSKMVLIPCFIETKGGIDVQQREKNDISDGCNKMSGKWILLVRFRHERGKKNRKNPLTFFFHVLDETPDKSIVDVLQTMFEGTPFAQGKIKWSTKTEPEVQKGDFSDSEARCAGWMGLIPILHLKQKNKNGFLGAVINSICAKELRIKNICQERRKWFDACIKDNIFFEPMGINRIPLKFGIVDSETFSALPRIPYRIDDHAQGDIEEISTAKKRQNEDGEETGHAKKRKPEGVSNASKSPEKATGKSHLQPLNNPVKQDVDVDAERKRQTLRNFFKSDE